MLTQEEFRQAIFLKWDEKVEFNTLDGEVFDAGYRAKKYGSLSVDSRAGFATVSVSIKSDVITILKLRINDNGLLYVEWLHPVGPWVEDFESICRIKLRYQKGKEDALKKKEENILLGYCSNN